MARSAERDIQELLEFRCVAPLRTVYRLLAEAGGLALLADPLMERATAEIVAGERPRPDVQRDIKAKERAREALVRKHRSAQLPEARAAPRLFWLSNPMRRSPSLPCMAGGVNPQCELEPWWGYQ
jgi:hypothetical protein